MFNTDVKSLKNNIWKKGLLVDDELKTKISQESLLNSLNIPSENIFFAADYESALKILQNHADIEAFSLDVRIPKNSHDFYDYKDDEHPDWGISLVPKINQLNKNAEIEVYSAQVTSDYIKEKINKFNNIKAFYGKDDKKNKRHERIIRLFRKSQFDYSVLNDTDADIIKQESIKIQDAYKTLFEKTIEIGESLLKIKNILGYGKFLPWLESTFNMHPKMAQRCMNVAKEFKLNRQDKITSDITLRFVPSALYALAEPSVPDSARDEAISKAKGGEKISVKMAYELKAKHKSKGITRVKIEETSKPSDEKLEIQPDTESAQSNQQIVKLLPQQKVWQLGEHFLFCGDPNSDNFLKQLPSKISLNLACPADRSWHFSYSNKIDSSVSFSSVYQNDLETSFFKTITEELVISLTDGNNIAVICFCPNPTIFEIAHTLGLQCFIAEPDRNKCQEIITHWEQINNSNCQNN